jgi:hypothetical protein
VKYVYHNNKLITKARNSIDIPLVYKAVTGKTLDKKQWLADKGKLDGHDWPEWVQKNDVKIQNWDSVRGL